MPPSFYEWTAINNNNSNNTSMDSNPREGEGEGEEQEKKGFCEWDFHLSTVISPTITGREDQQVSDILGAIEFDPSDQFLATGGIARKLRIYSLNSLLSGGGGGGAVFANDGSECSYYICTPAKLSSLRWKPGSGSRVIGSGDYDGVVTEYDLERHVPVFERDEHGGRRVWSVDYSHHFSHLGASGSDDGTAQLWDARCVAGTACGTLLPGDSAPVCSVEFDQLAGSKLVGLGCADRKAYVYDLRMGSVPLSVFRGHRRTVTYVRFVGGGRVVTASTDGCLKLWDSVNSAELRKYEGHVNRKSFVGLSVWGGGGLLGCGSESNEVYVYDMRWGEPIWVQGFDGDGGDTRGFVSGVCWRQAAGEEDECMLVAGGSNGALQVYVGKRKKKCF